MQRLISVQIMNKERLRDLKIKKDQSFLNIQDNNSDKHESISPKIFTLKLKQNDLEERLSAKKLFKS